MRITRIESIILLDKLHIVKVHTDEGLVGVGEVSPMNAHVTHSVVEQALTPLLSARKPPTSSGCGAGCTRSRTSSGPAVPS